MRAETMTTGGGGGVEGGVILSGTNKYRFQINHVRAETLTTGGGGGSYTFGD